jgi:superfamily II DNA/RNA helicase
VRGTHHLWSVSRDERVDTCADIVAAAGSTVVFVRTRHGADRLTRQLGKAGIRAVPIHGDRSQAQRTRALDAFSSGRAEAMVATDVAARGIHVDDVACVVHFDLPPEAKDYVHRSGRTARAGAEGVVVALVLPEQRKDAAALVKKLSLDVEPGDVDILGAFGRTGQRHPRPARDTSPAPSTGSGNAGGAAGKAGAASTTPSPARSREAARPSRRERARQRELDEPFREGEELRAERRTGAKPYGSRRPKPGTARGPKQSSARGAAFGSSRHTDGDRPKSASTGRGAKPGGGPGFKSSGRRGSKPAGGFGAKQGSARGPKSPGAQRSSRPPGNRNRPR